MFYQAYTARNTLKVAVTVHSRYPLTPGGHGMVLSAARHLWAHTLQCIVTGDDAAVFLVVSLVTSERGTEHVFCVNLAQIRSAIPEIFRTQTKKSQTVLKTESYAVYCLWLIAIKTRCMCLCVCYPIN